MHIIAAGPSSAELQDTTGTCRVLLGVLNPPTRELGLHYGGPNNAALPGIEIKKRATDEATLSIISHKTTVG